MICERCKKKEATVFYEETINGASRSYSLCAECAAELNKSGEFSGLFSLGGVSSLHDQLFGGLFGLSDAHAKARKTCPLCASTFSDFQKDGKTGCPECYKVFSEELKNTIRSIHGNVKHIGRSPSKFRKNREKENELKELKTKLKEAIANENFELAAELRDKVRALEGKQDA